MRKRLSYWWQVLRMGADQVNVAFGWIGTFILIGSLIGFGGHLALHRTYSLIAAILLGLLVCMTAEGGYRVWRNADQARKDAQASGDAARQDRSVAAAGRLVDLIVALDGQVANWQAGSQDSVPSGLTDAYNQFAQKQVAASGELTDEDLRNRVHLHAELTRVCLAAIGKDPEPRPQVARVLRDHASCVVRALQAHQQGTELPAYNPPPLKPFVPAALFAWQPAPEH
jgi:hypothetical protein